ncbi:DUF2971 domain-containing protein [Algoriphagus yeomjeoni]|uniref:DUF2971 domain-containing protein n=1 Tax=Algoriphagus yeomjeoni TaxID=291403 RepID=UPI003CE4E677
MNDPFDCSMEHLISRESQLSNEGKDFIRTNTKEFGVCCFSEDPLNLHMWSHYGNSYKGFCLEFDKEIIQSFCSDLFQANCELLQCKYDEYPINLDERITWEIDGDYIQEVPLRWILECPKKTDRLFQMLLLQKNEKVWGQEQEWRIILSGRAIRNGARNHAHKSNGYRIPLPEGAIKSIFLGPNMSDPDKEKIELINQEFYAGSIELKEIKLDHNNWGLRYK